MEHGPFENILDELAQVTDAIAQGDMTLFEEQERLIQEMNDHPDCAMKIRFKD